MMVPPAMIRIQHKNAPSTVTLNNLTSKGNLRTMKQDHQVVIGWVALILRESWHSSSHWRERPWYCWKICAVVDLQLAGEWENITEFWATFRENIPRTYGVDSAATGKIHIFPERSEAWDTGWPMTAGEPGPFNLFSLKAPRDGILGPWPSPINLHWVDCQCAWSHQSQSSLCALRRTAFSNQS